MSTAAGRGMREAVSPGGGAMKRKANGDIEDIASPPKGSLEKVHQACGEQTVCNFPSQGDCKTAAYLKRLKLTPKSPNNESPKSPFSGTLYSCSLNSPGTTIKHLYIQNQLRHVIEQKVSKVSAKGGVTLTYKVKSETTGTILTLQLKNLWAELDWLTPGMLVNIVGVTPTDGVLALDRLQGYLIVEPDRLVSVTSVISHLYCHRKAALSRFYMGGDNAVTFRGVVAHELICMAMVDKIKDEDDLKKALKRICQRPGMLERAYGIGMTDEELAKIQADVAEWVLRFIKKRFIPESSQTDSKYQNFKFNGVLGVEDNIWNPTYGMKGKIDATVQIVKDNKKMTVPLEFKTGSTKSQKRQAIKSDHVAQVTLYTLMMNMKFGKVEEALLYYISDDSLSAHPTKVFELQQLILQRNHYVRNTTLANGELPNLPSAEGIDFDFKCKNCDAKNICTLQITRRNQSVENLPSTEKKLVEQCELSEAELKFFGDWWVAINSETEEVEKKFNDKEIWTKPPEEREENGTCVANLRILDNECRPWKDGNLKIGFMVTFRKRHIARGGDHCLHVDDFVALSSNIEICINYGVIVLIRGDEITLSFEQPLHPEYFTGDFVYAIDKINTTSPIASQYGYLAKLMDNTTEAARLREYIIMKKQPRFAKSNIPEPPIQVIFRHLNNEQKRVVMKAMSTDSFLFVKGTPGSGKTATIVALIRALVVYKKSVLVVSYTGTALENILLRYKVHSNNFIKISTSGRADPKLTQFTTKEIAKRMRQIRHLAEEYNKPVVATTLLSLKHPIFQRRRFDYCIVDEASQALPTAVFGALSLCDKYIVFGDPNQLPPVMSSSVLKTLNLSDNFFSLMATPLSSIKMNTQYRMNRGITQVANALVYENQMLCGDSCVERAYVQLKETNLRHFLKTQVNSPVARQVLCRVVSKKRERSVVFLDTSEVAAYNTRVEESLCNAAEIDLVISCCRIMIESGLPSGSVGIIAPFRGQVRLLRKSLSNMPDTRYGEIEVNTVDQYQGKEMDVIICSFTKSLPPDSVFYANKNAENGPQNQNDRESILEDIRRLNVAITRARVKLILIGNSRTLSCFSPFRKLFEILEEGQHHKLTSTELTDVCQLAKAHLNENDENVHHMEVEHQSP